MPTNANELQNQDRVGQYDYMGKSDIWRWWWRRGRRNGGGAEGNSRRWEEEKVVVEMEKVGGGVDVVEKGGERG